jgi:putative copper resistance protein D
VHSNAWDIGTIIVKAVVYAATLGAAGGLFFLHYCRTQIPNLTRRHTRRLVAILILVALGCSLVRIPLLSASMSGEAAGMLDPNLAMMIWHSGEGHASAVRMVGMILAAFAVASSRQTGAVPILGAGIAATSFAWTGHVHALRPDWLPIVLIGVHLLGIAFWLGALPPLLMLTHDPDRAAMVASVRQFGTLAVIVVAVLVTAGAVLLWMLTGNLTQLWASAYGRALSVKIGLVALLLAVAAFNKLILTPRLSGGDPQAVSAFRRTLVIEMIAAAAILLGTATLTTLLEPPALG